MILHLEVKFSSKLRLVKVLLSSVILAIRIFEKWLPFRRYPRLYLCFYRQPPSKRIPLSSGKLFGTLNISLSLRVRSLFCADARGWKCPGGLVSSSPNARNYVSGKTGGTGDGKKKMDTKDTDGRRGPQRPALRRTLIYIELRWTLVSTSNGFSRVYVARLPKFRRGISSESTISAGLIHSFYF